MSNYVLKTLSIKDEEDCIAIFKAAYRGLEVPEQEEKCFNKELSQSLRNQDNYHIHFLGYSYDDKIVSFAGIAQSLFMENSWELRWGTTHPDFQNQGLMSQLIDHRIEFAEKKNSKQPGVIHVCARQPNIYLRKGFDLMFTRGPENKASYCVKYLNLDASH